MTGIIRAGKRNIIAVISFVVLLVGVGSICFFRYHENKAPGLLEISTEGGNCFTDPASGVKIYGYDTGGTTYFFLPSFIHTERIEQVSDTIMIYYTDGSIMNKTAFGEIQDILVDSGDGNMIPWQMCFMRSENLSSLYINPINNSDINELSRETYINAEMTVYSPEGERAFVPDKVQVKGRGNYSWQSGKKPIEIKLGGPASLCGLSPSRKWALLSDYYDPTMMLNKLALDLAEKIEVGNTSDSDWIDVYYAGTYMGNYILCKEPSTSTSNAEFLFRKEIPHTYQKKQNKFKVQDMGFVLDNPDEVNQEYMEDITQYVSDIDRSIREGTYEDWIDKESFIKRYLIEEFLYNADAMSHSYYFYKYPGSSKLYAGPSWDYDLAGGGFFGAKGLYYDYDISILDMTDDPGYITDKEEWLDWDKELFENPSYYSDAQRIYGTCLGCFEDVVYNGIDEAYKRIKYSAAMDNIRWNEKTRHYYDYYNEIRHLKFFLSHRLDHMDAFFHRNDGTIAVDTNFENFHKVKYVLADGEEKEIEVKDGTRLTENDLPQKADDGYGWVKDISDEVLFSEFFPIYEDTIFELKEISFES